MTQYNLTINNNEVAVEADPQSPLLFVLRSLGLRSPRYGCGLAQCGSCRILVDGEPEYACTKLVSDATNADIETIEGLGENSHIKLIQQAFIANNAGQCGYCLGGIIISTVHLLKHNPAPDRGEIQLALDDHLCRCGAHNRIIKAIQSVVDALGERDAGIA